MKSLLEAVSPTAAALLSQEKTEHVLDVLNTDPSVIRTAMGWTNHKMDDERLFVFINTLGSSAQCLTIPSAAQDRLQWLYAMVFGWLASLGQRDITEAVALERARQNALFRDHKISFNCASPLVDPKRKLRVLVEEIGEVAEAIDQLEGAQTAVNKAHLKTELIQVAAVIVAWLEGLQ